MCSSPLAPSRVEGADAVWLVPGVIFVVVVFARDGVVVAFLVMASS